MGSSAGCQHMRSLGFKTASPPQCPSTPTCPPSSRRARNWVLWWLLAQACAVYMACPVCMAVSGGGQRVFGDRKGAGWLLRQSSGCAASSFAARAGAAGPARPCSGARSSVLQQLATCSGAAVHPQPALSSRAPGSCATQLLLVGRLRLPSRIEHAAPLTLQAHPPAGQDL